MENREHMLYNSTLYSMYDLVMCANRQLLPALTSAMEVFINHITISCEVCLQTVHPIFFILPTLTNSAQSCRGKGWVCEVCNSCNLIFSFQLKTTWYAFGTIYHFERLLTSIVFRCPECKSLF